MTIDHVNIRTAAAVLPLLLSVAGCAPRTTQADLPVDVPGSFSASGEATIPDRWWTGFEDPELDRLVDTALRSNLDLAAAWSRLREAGAAADEEYAALFPALDAELDGQVSRAGDEDVNERLGLGLAAEYEIDLWGRVSSTAEAERLRAAATLEDYRTAALTLSAEVAGTWLRLIEARSQRDLIEEQIGTNEQVLSLIRTRLGVGQVRGVDIIRQRQLLESTREQRIAAESRIGVLEHSLAVLLGLPPRSDVTAGTGRLPGLPPLPATGLPSELVRRRPDVRGAFALLRASDEDLASAVSAMYPRLSLTGSISGEDGDVDGRIDEWFRSLAGSLVAPIFRGGELRAGVDRAEAVRQRRIYEYGQTVLTALREVEDALIREQKQMETIESLERQLDLARQTYEQLRVEYFNGVGDYLEVLTALTAVQRIQRDSLSARLLLLEYRVALYRALAGGFETEREMAS